MKGFSFLALFQGRVHYFSAVAVIDRGASAAGLGQRLRRGKDCSALLVPLGQVLKAGGDPSCGKVGQLMECLAHIGNGQCQDPALLGTMGGGRGGNLCGRKTKKPGETGSAVNAWRA